MKAIITGHLGLIGSFLKKRLEEKGFVFVKSFDLRCDKDINDIKYIELKEKVDIVFHLAAHCKINESILSPRKSHENNSDGTFEVLEFCRNNNIKKIVNFSSSRILSKEKNPYTASKIYGEELCKGYKQCYGIDYINIRPSTVYGPFDDLTHRLVDIFIRNALEDKDLVIFGNPDKKTLDFTYVDDFVDGIIMAINGPWNVDYNISGGEEFKVYDLAKLIINLTNSKSKIVIKDAEKAQPQEVSLDISAIKKRGYSPKINIEEGIKRCIIFYRKLLWDEKYNLRKKY